MYEISDNMNRRIKEMCAKIEKEREEDEEDYL